MLKVTLGIVAALALATLQASAQFSLTGTSYTQDFDSLGSAGTDLSPLTGWVAGTNQPPQSASGDLNARTNGVITSQALVVTDGATTSGFNYNVGTTGSGERAVGAIGSSLKTRLTEFSFINNTGVTITDLTISYTGEQWRLGKTGPDAGSGLPDTMLFAYGTDGITFTVAGSSFNFVSPTTAGTVGPLDGNLAANRTTGLGGTLTGVNIANGATFYLRWIDPDSAGSDNLLAIDDFSLTATLIPEPSTMMLVGFGLLGMLALRRRS